MGFLSQLTNVFTGSEDAKARNRAGEVQQQQAISSATDLGQASQSAISRFDPLAAIGQQGIDLAGFLGNPQAQAEMAFNNPLFKLSRQAMTEDINQSAASRGRLTAGDTLQRLDQAGAVAAQPFIDRQRQDILNLLGISQNVTGKQAGIELNTAQDIANLLTGGAAAKAGGIVGAQNARTGAMGNVIDVAAMAAGMPPGTFTGGNAQSGGNAQTFNNAPIGPVF